MMWNYTTHSLLIILYENVINVEAWSPVALLSEQWHETVGKAVAVVVREGL